MADARHEKAEPTGTVPGPYENPLIHRVQSDSPTVAKPADTTSDSRSIAVPAAPTEEKIGKAWDRAIGSDPKQQDAAFGAIDKAIVGKAKSAMAGATDKEDALSKLEQKISDSVAVEGGPTLRLNGDQTKLTIAHMRVASEDESKKLESMTPEQRAKATAFKIKVGSEGHNDAEKWVVPVLPPKTYDVTDKPLAAAKPAAEAAVTKEPTSADVSAAAFAALKDRTGLDLLDPKKWDAKTPEQQYWTQSMADAYKNRGELPPGVKVKAEAAVGVGGADIVNKAVGSNLEETGRKDSLYLAGSMSSEQKWDGKAKTMDVKDEQGNPVKNPNRPDGKVDSIYKQGKVYDVDGTKVFEIYNDKTNGRMFAVADPGNLKAGMDYSKYAQSMVDKALKTEGKPGPIEFPAYEKKVDQKMDGLIGLGVKGTDFVIAQAKMKGVFAANKDGEFSKETQAFEIHTRSISIAPPDPPATRLDSSKIIIAKTTDSGHVWTSAKLDATAGDYKKPDIEALKKEYN